MISCEVWVGQVSEVMFVNFEYQEAEGAGLNKCLS